MLEGLAAGGLSLAGGMLANSANAKTAAKQMAFEAQQAELNRSFNSTEANINREFQRHQSDNAHAREVADLRRAGLNPILSATGGPGAAATSGSAAQGSSAKSAGFQAVDALGNAVSSALAAKRNTAEVKNMEMMNKNIDMDTNLKLEQKRAAHESIYRTKWESDLTEEQFRSERARAKMYENQIPGSNTEANIDRSAYGQGLRYADRIGKTIGSALGARRIFQQRD